MIAPGLALLCSLVLVAACAVMEPPPGGPLDKIPPHLVSSLPESASVSVDTSAQVLKFLFSEKMDRQPAYSWLHTFPDQPIRKTKWHGAIEAEVFLEHSLPADTVVVFELVSGMKDAHKVANKSGRRFPISTGDSIPDGEIVGVLVIADSTVSNGVVELYDVPPDTLEYFEQPLLRRTSTGPTGEFKFSWLPRPGGPWLLRAFTDPDNNRSPGEREAQRLLPDTLSLTLETAQVSIGINKLYPYNTPGVLYGDGDIQSSYGGAILAWTMAITDADTGYTGAPITAGTQSFHWFQPTAVDTLTDVSPGRNRVIVFVDVDNDSTFSVVPDSLLGVARPLDAEEPLWFLEPWGQIEDVELEPGLSASFTWPATADSLVSWTAPAPVVVPALEDSLVQDDVSAEEPPEKP